MVGEMMLESEHIGYWGRYWLLAGVAAARRPSHWLTRTQALSPGSGPAPRQVCLRGIRGVFATRESVLATRESAPAAVVIVAGTGTVWY
jgi:hypothetical protein